MLQKINIIIVLLDHIDTFRIRTRDGRDRFSYTDIITFFSVPAGVSLAYYLVGAKIDNSSIGIIVSIFSLLTGLLLNLLVLVHGVAKALNLKEEVGRRVSESRVLMKELTSNIGFGIMVSILIVVIFLSMVLGVPDWKSTLSAFGVFLMSMFVVNILMIIRRVHVAVTMDLN